MPWRQRSPEGNVDTVLEELQNDLNGGMVEVDEGEAEFIRG